MFLKKQDIIRNLLMTEGDVVELFDDNYKPILFESRSVSVIDETLEGVIFSLTSNTTTGTKYTVKGLMDFAGQCIEWYDIKK